MDNTNGSQPSSPPINLANALNAGHPVWWPKRTNAIRVRLINGKTATVLRGDEGTLRGTGIDESALIEFGWVPFDRQRPPDRGRFTPAKATEPSQSNSITRTRGQNED